MTRETIDKANTIVLKKEKEHVLRLCRNLNTEQDREVRLIIEDELFEEKDRLSGKGKFDHEEVWYATGHYTKGRI